MTPAERRAAVERLVARHGWSLTPDVVDFVASHEAFQSDDTIEVTLTLGLDMASLRGEPLSIAILERLTAPAGPSAKVYPKNPSRLISAIEDGQPSELRRAVRARNANLEEVSDYRDGMTPLLLALFQRDLKMTQILVDAGADVGNRGRYREAPIHLAINGKGTKRLELLLAAGADPDSRDADDRTPLMHAARDDKHLDKTEVLLAANADPSLTDREGRTALDIARSAGASAIAAVLEKRRR